MIIICIQHLECNKKSKPLIVFRIRPVSVLNIILRSYYLYKIKMSIKTNNEYLIKIKSTQRKFQNVQFSSPKMKAFESIL